MSEVCENCGQITQGNFCNNCANPLKHDRIDKAYAKNEFLNLIGYEKGFVFTVKELILRPVQNISAYLNGHRNKLTKPLTFLLLSSVIYSLINSYLEISIKYDKAFKKLYKDSFVADVFIWVQENFGYSNILMMVLIGFWIKIIFKKYSFNFYEILVILCFAMGQSMLYLIFELINTKYFQSTFLSSIIYLAVFSYIFYIVGGVFEKKFSNYFKAFVSYLFGFISFYIIVFIVGIVGDIFVKNYLK